MKKQSITLGLVFMIFCINAQKIKVESGSYKFSSGSHDAIVSTIYEADIKTVIKEWKHVLKDFKHEKVKDDNEEVFGDNVLIKDWGNNAVDFYTKFVENEKEKCIKMYTAVDLGGTYMNKGEHKDQYKFTEKMCYKFAVEMTKTPIKERLHDEEKAFGKLEDGQKDLEKENNKLKSDIEDYKKKIADAENDIKKNEENQKKQKELIEAAKKTLDETKKKLDSVD
ncbi:MAG: coiled-coil domain-containing protein [Bacteroidia bacterium]